VLVVEAVRRGYHRVELDPATYAAVLTHLSSIYAVGRAVEVKRDDASYAMRLGGLSPHDVTGGTTWIKCTLDYAKAKKIIEGEVLKQILRM